MSRSWTPLINLISNSLPADRWLITYNLVLINIVLFHAVWRYCVWETDSLFVNDTKFPTAVELTLDAYEFMELQRIGRAPVKSLNVGPVEPEVSAPVLRDYKTDRHLLDIAEPTGRFGDNKKRTRLAIPQIADQRAPSLQRLHRSSTESVPIARRPCLCSSHRHGTA